jgi:phosphatidylglycerophosphate synthase
VNAFVDGYHTGLWVTIVLLAAGVLVSYLTLRPRAARQTAAGPAAGPAEITAIGEIEAIGELVIPDEFMITARANDTE